MSLVGLPFQRTHSLALLGRSPLNGGALKSALGFVVGVWVLMPVCGASASPEEEPAVPDLISQYRNRDGAAGAKISLEISRAFVAHPRSWLGAMASQPDVFNDWLKGLADETFVAWDPSQQAGLAKLKHDMEKTAAGAKDSNDIPMASRILARLKGIKIRVVD